MLVDDEILAMARNGNRDAIVEVLSAQYPASHRMALAINGRADVGGNVVALVMKQSFRAIGGWNDNDAPQRWFRHHTMLTARHAARWKPVAGTDTLVRAEDRDHAPYLAFIRALRLLPQQQVEAFVLTHGEGLDTRGIAVAMDCSTTAAANHLREAENRLRELAGGEFDSLVKRMRDAYAALAPSKDIAMERVSQEARRYLLPRRVKRVLFMFFALLVAAALAYVVWRLR